MLKIIFIIIIVVIIFGMIGSIAEKKENSQNDKNEIPPDYRVSNWTSEWIRPIYTCNGCEYSCVKSSNNGKYKHICKKYNTQIDPDYVCDGYVEREMLASFKDPGTVFIPFKGHLDKSPYDV